MVKLLNTKVILCIGMLAATSAWAASDYTTFKSDDAFPESRFGQPPARPDNGGSRYAARMGTLEEEEMPAHQSDYSGVARGSRRPAGLEFARGGVTPPPAIVESAPVPRLEEEARMSAGQSSSDSPLGRIPGIKKGVQEVSIIAGDLGYFPRTIFVNRDIPVRLFVTGSSKSTLCIMMDSFQVKKQVRAQKIEEITFTPGTPGKFRFYCPIGNLEGTLVVREFTSSTDEGAEHQAGSSDGSGESGRKPVNEAAAGVRKPASAVAVDDQSSRPMPAGI